MKRILQIAVGLVLLSSCKVKQEEINKCETLCEKNEGVKYIFSGISGNMCRCNNGLGKQLK